MTQKISQFCPKVTNHGQVGWLSFPSLTVTMAIIDYVRTLIYNINIKYDKTHILLVAIYRRGGV